MQSSELV